MNIINNHTKAVGVGAIFTGTLVAGASLFFVLAFFKSPYIPGISALNGDIGKPISIVSLVFGGIVAGGGVYLVRCTRASHHIVESGRSSNDFTIVHAKVRNIVCDHISKSNIQPEITEYVKAYQSAHREMKFINRKKTWIEIKKTIPSKGKMDVNYTFQQIGGVKGEGEIKFVERNQKWIKRDEDETDSASTNDNECISSKSTDESRDHKNKENVEEEVKKFIERRIRIFIEGLEHNRKVGEPLPDFVSKEQEKERTINNEKILVQFQFTTKSSVLVATYSWKEQDIVRQGRIERDFNHQASKENSIEGSSTSTQAERTEKPDAREQTPDKIFEEYMKKMSRLLEERVTNELKSGRENVNFSFSDNLYINENDEQPVLVKGTVSHTKKCISITFQFDDGTKIWSQIRTLEFKTVKDH